MSGTDQLSTILDSTGPVVVLLALSDPNTTAGGATERKERKKTRSQVIISISTTVLKSRLADLCISVQGMVERLHDVHSVPAQ